VCGGSKIVAVVGEEFSELRQSPLPIVVAGDFFRHTPRTGARSLKQITGDATNTHPAAAPALHPATDSLTILSSASQGFGAGCELGGGRGKVCDFICTQPGAAVRSTTRELRGGAAAYTTPRSSRGRCNGDEAADKPAHVTVKQMSARGGYVWSQGPTAQ
jgi:hypothetical protein